MAVLPFLRVWRAGASLEPWDAALSLRRPLLLKGTGSRLGRLQQSPLPAPGQGSVAVAQRLGFCGTWGLPRSGTTSVFCVGRWILYHWAARHSHSLCFKKVKSDKTKLTDNDNYWGWEIGICASSPLHVILSTFKDAWNFSITKCLK